MRYIVQATVQAVLKAGSDIFSGEFHSFVWGCFHCNGPIDEILDEVFKDSGISYIVKNKEVILNVQKTNNTQQKKKRTVTGTIIDAVVD